MHILSQHLPKLLFAFLIFLFITSCQPSPAPEVSPRERISLNEGWKFMKYESEDRADQLIYDVRPEVAGRNDSKDADSEPTEAVDVNATQEVLKAWILPTGNDFLKDPTKHYVRPEGDPGHDFPFVQKDLLYNYSIDFYHNLIVKN